MPIHRIVAPTVALVVALVAARPASGQGPTAGATGRIEGAVVLLPSVSSRKPQVRLYTNYGPNAAAGRDSIKTNELRNVVVYIDSIALTPPPANASTARLAIQQVKTTFVPHVLTVLQGSTVEFPNSDPVFHNVFSLSKTRSFDLGRYPYGASKSVRFDKPGTVQVFCQIHSDMSAIVQVVSNPFFATPSDAGRYSIEGVPVGVYRVVAWHERVGRVVREVRVAADQATVLDLALPMVDDTRGGR